jgi:DNA replication protein DnaC
MTTPRSPWPVPNFCSKCLSQRYEQGATLVTSNLPFDEWTEVLGSERLTGALLDRLTHHVHILEMNGDSYRLNQSQKRRKSPKST